MIIVRVEFGADDETRLLSSNRRVQVVGPFADLEDVQRWVRSVADGLRVKGVGENDMPSFSTTIVSSRRLALTEIRRTVLRKVAKS